MSNDRDRTQVSSEPSTGRPIFTAEMIHAALKEAEPGVADLSKKLKEMASRSETFASLRLR